MVCQQRCPKQPPPLHCSLPDPWGSGARGCQLSFVLFSRDAVHWGVLNTSPDINSYLPSPFQGQSDVALQFSGTRLSPKFIHLTLGLQDECSRKKEYHVPWAFLELITLS